MRKRDKEDKRDPFAGLSRPAPGGSIRDQIVQQIESVLPLLVVGVFLLGLFLGMRLAEPLVRYGIGWPKWLVGAAAVVVIAVIWWRVNRTDPYISQLGLALRGEQFVAEELRRLPAPQFSVYHDIPPLRPGGANVDHLVVSQGGIFVIETKARTKPSRGNCEVRFDGKRLLVNGYEPSRDPIGQVRAIADEVTERLERATNRKLRSAVQAIVVFPRWFIADTRSRNARDVWLHNEKTMVKWIANANERLDDTTLAAVRAAIETLQSLQQESQTTWRKS